MPAYLLTPSSTSHLPLIKSFTSGSVHTFSSFNSSLCVVSLHIGVNKPPHSPIILFFLKYLVTSYIFLVKYSFLYPPFSYIYHALYFLFLSFFSCIAFFIHFTSFNFILFPLFSSPPSLSSHFLSLILPYFVFSIFPLLSPLYIPFSISFYPPSSPHAPSVLLFLFFYLFYSLLPSSQKFFASHSSLVLLLLDTTPSFSPPPLFSICLFLISLASYATVL